MQHRQHNLYILHHSNELPSVWSDRVELRGGRYAPLPLLKSIPEATACRCHPPRLQGGCSRCILWWLPPLGGLSESKIKLNSKRGIRNHDLISALAKTRNLYPVHPPPISSLCESDKKRCTQTPSSRWVKDLVDKYASFLWFHPLAWQDCLTHYP